MVVHAVYPLGETRVQRQSAALVDRGFEVDVICLRDSDEPARGVHDGVRVYRLPIRRRRGRGYAVQLLEYLAFFLLATGMVTVLQLRRRYQSVQVHNLPDFLVLSALFPKLVGARVFLDLHDLMPEFFAARAGVDMDSRVARVILWQERQACRFADHVITVTDGWRETLIRRGVPADKASVVMNVADARIFHPTLGRPEPSGPDGFKLVYHGTLAERYGVDLILDAVSELRNDLPQLTASLIGDGELRETLIEKRSALGLDDCVEISEGMVEASHLPTLIGAADVGVVPNRRDVFTQGLLPTKLMEYVAMGVPVIASRTSMIESYFDDDMVKFFEPGDAADLADAIRTLAADRGRLQILAENADAFNRKYGWESAAAAYAGLIDASSAGQGSQEDGSDVARRASRALTRGVRRAPDHARYALRLSSAADDPDWDKFLAATPGGHHTQSSLWGQVKASTGWRAFRVIAERDGLIVGGAQVLHRPLSVMGAVGYAARAPVVAEADPALARILMDEVEKAARDLRIRHLTVQPPGRGEDPPRYLEGRGYLPTAAEIAPRATVLIDVTREPDEILAAMSSKTRYNIRLSARKSIAVREGGLEDIDTYYELLRATAERQGFTPLPKAHYLQMWRVLSPRGCIRLSFAELDGEALSGQVALAFGDTVVNKMSVWSGRAGNRRPNEALQWAAIEWAHANGYRHYDLEGLKLGVARALVRGEPLPESAGQTVASYKLGFGGKIVVMPGAQTYIPNRAMRWGFAELYPRIADFRRVKNIVKSVRTSGRNSGVGS